jgi:hypothetical protein
MLGKDIKIPVQQVCIKRYGKLNNCQAKDLMTWFLKKVDLTDSLILTI